MNPAIFLLQARNNLELGGFKAKGIDDCSKHSGSVPAINITGRIGYLEGCGAGSFRWYLYRYWSGAYIKSKSRDDMRVNSAFTFGEKSVSWLELWGFFLQKLISGISRMDHSRIKNSGHNFVGASISYNF